ncbi:MAG: hypothetical protein QW472_04620, partial [Candidatus Aenigmatarchaeota archaeon]
MEEDLTNFPFREEIERIKKYVKNREVLDRLVKIVERYRALDSELNLNFLTKEAIEYIAATSEETQDEKAIELAIRCFELEEIERILKKYRKNKLNVSEIFSDIGALIHRKISKGEYNIDMIKKYFEWLENGFISRFLNFIAEFPGNGMAPIQQNIFDILSLDPSQLDIFNQSAMKIYRKKITIEKKVELISLLSLLSMVKKYEYFDVLVMGDVKKLRYLIEKELSLPLPTKYSLECGIKFIEDVKKDPNLQFIYKKTIEHKDFGKWLRQDDVTRNVLNVLEGNGFDSELFLDSGEQISQKKASEGFSERWVDVFKHVVIKILGSKQNELLPKISIPNHSPGSVYMRIKEDYKKALEEDNNAAKNVLTYFSTLIRNSYKDKRMPNSVSSVLQEIEALNYMIESGTITNYQG